MQIYIFSQKSVRHQKLICQNVARSRPPPIDATFVSSRSEDSNVKLFLSLVRSSLCPARDRTWPSRFTWHCPFPETKTSEWQFLTSQDRRNPLIRCLTSNRFRWRRSPRWPGSDSRTRTMFVCFHSLKQGALFCSTVTIRASYLIVTYWYRLLKSKQYCVYLMTR